MRIEDAEQRLRDLRKLVVDLQVNARGEKGERFQQALDVRIVAFVRLQDQPPGDFRVFLAELRAKLAKVVSSRS